MQSLSRGARKRLQRHCQAEPNHSIPERVAEDNASFVPDMADDIQKRLGEEAVILWESWVRAVDKCAKRLDSQGCWAFYKSNRKAAIVWQMEKELRWLVEAGAKKFMRAGEANLSKGKCHA